MNHRVSIVLALALSTIILGGCATSATHQAMTVHPQANAIAVNPKLKGAIHVGLPTREICDRTQFHKEVHV